MSEESSEKQPNTLFGVKGWLLFLCIALTVLSPMRMFFDLNNMLRETIPYFSMAPGLLVIVVLITVLTLALAGFSIYSGIALWKLKPRAVLITKRYLLIFLAYSFLSLLIIVFSIPPEVTIGAMFHEALKSLYQPLIFFGVWYSYLLKSERVKATYANIE